MHSGLIIKKQRIMNLFKKGIFALLVTVLVISCDDEFEPIQPSLNSNGQGISEITFSSFDATSGPDADGLNDGTDIVYHAAGAVRPFRRHRGGCPAGQEHG